MPDKAPVCPWCGEEMKYFPYLENGVYFGAYHCSCGAFSPAGECVKTPDEAIESAYAAAMKRFEPMQKPCDDCAGIVYRQTASGKIVPDGQCAVKFPPPCYRPDGDGCAYQIYGDYDDEPIDKCKECPLCYTDKVRREQKPTDEERKAGWDE